MHVGRHGEHARHVLPAVRGGPVLDVLAVGGHDHVGDVVRVIVVVAVVMHPVGVHVGVQGLVALPVVPQCLQELGAGADLIVEHQLFDGRQAVRRGAQADALRAGVVVDRAASADVHAFVDAAVDQQAEVRQRLEPLLRQVDLVDHADHPVAPVFQLEAEALDHLVEAREGVQSAGIRAQALPRTGTALVEGAGGGAVDAAAVVDGQMDRLRQIEGAGVVPAVGLPGNAGLHAADADVVPGVLQGLSVVHQRPDHRLVVEDLGLAGADADHVEHLDLELLGRPLVQAHAHPGVRDAGVGVGVQHHVAQVVGDVVPLLVHAAHVQGGPAHDRAAGERDGHRVADLAQGVHQAEGVLDQLLALLARHQAALHGLSVVRPEDLVEAAVGHAVAVGLDDDHVGGDMPQLDGFPEVPGRSLGHLQAVGGDPLQFLPADGIRLLRSHPRGQFAVPADVRGGALDCDELRLVEVHALHVFGPGFVQRRHALFHLAAQAAEAHGQQLFVVGRHVADAGVHEQALLRHALALVAALDLFRGVHGQRRLGDGAALPVVLHGVHVVDDVLGYHVAVVLPLVHGTVSELIHQPVEGEFRIQRCGFRRRAQLAHDQLVGPDVDLHPAVDLPQGHGPLHVLGIHGEVSVTLGDDLRPLAVGGVVRVLQPVQHLVDAGERGRILRQAGDAHAPLPVVGLDGQRPVRRGVDVSFVDHCASPSLIPGGWPACRSPGSLSRSRLRAAATGAPPWACPGSPRRWCRCRSGRRAPAGRTGRRPPRSAGR